MDNAEDPDPPSEPRIKRGDRRELRVRYQEEVDRASRRLLEDPDADITQHVRRLEAYSTILSAIERRPESRVVWIVAVSVICIVLAGILWGGLVHETKIVLNIQSEAVAMELADNWLWSGNQAMGGTFLQVEGLTEVDGAVLGTPLESPHGDGWIQISGGEVSLVRLEAGPNSVVQLITTPDGNLSTYFRGAEVVGEFAARGSVEFRAGERPGEVQRQASLDLAIPETVTFTSQAAGAVPVRVQGQLAESWRLNDISVRALGFQREIPSGPGEVVFVPTILEGTITLPEVSRTVTLRAKEHIALAGLRGRVVEMRLEQDVSVVFQGTAREVRLGPPGYAENLMPTYLEYFYFNQPLAFFWGAIVFFWGLLWGARRTLFP